MPRAIFPLLFLFVALIFATGLYFFTFGRNSTSEELSETNSNPAAVALSQPTATLPQQILLRSDYHVFQSFNNCAPAALSMALSYYGISVSQETLAKSLRPFNNPKGLNDDKSTPPLELAAEAERYGLKAYFRAGGDMETLKRLLSAGQPVVVRTLLYADQDYAHYRVVRGYDEKTKEIIEDDSFQGKNIRYSYDEFNKLWKPFNYAYLVLAAPEKKSEVERILGEYLDSKAAWEKSLAIAETELKANQNDKEARFNLAVAHYYLGNYRQTIAEFEKIERELPRHTLWYQMEPIEAYFETGDYGRVFALAESILSDSNKAYSELYLLKGKSRLKLGQADLAGQEFELALFYNVNSKAAKDALASLPQI